MSLQVLVANDVVGARMLAANEIGDVGGGNKSSDGSKHMEPKTGRLKSQKLAKSRKSFKSKGEKSKNLSKSGNLPNFNTTEADLSFLIPQARAAFNCLRLAFIEAPIL